MSFRFLHIVSSVITTCLLVVAPLASQQISESSSSLDEGKRLYEAGQFTEAEAVFQTIVKNEKKVALAHYWFGMAIAKQQRDKDAIKAFKKAVKEDKTLVDGYIQMGRVYLRMDKKKDARKAFEKAVKLDSDNAEIHYYMGLSHVEKVRLAKIRRGKIKDMFKKQHDAFQRAIDLDPNHHDAHYRLGLAYETLLDDLSGAIPLYFKQAAVTPSHREALQHLSQACIKTEQFEHGVDLFKQLGEMHGDETNPVFSGFAAQVRAYDFQSKKQESRALQAYETYLASLEKIDPDESTLYRDLTLVAPKEILEQYGKASDEVKTEIWRQYWAARDPDPSTAVSERLTEHYRRVMYARQNFSKGKQPWDQRGEIYIRYGEPDDRQHFVFRSGSNVMQNYMPTGNSKIDAVRETNRYQYQLNVTNGETNTLWEASEDPLGGLLQETRGSSYATESWVYVPYNMEIFFTDQMSNGNYDFPLLETQLPSSANDFGLSNSPGFRFMTSPRQRVAALIKKQPESYRFDYGGEPLVFVFDLVTFKGTDGQAQVEVAYSVPSNQLGDASDGQGMETWLSSRIALQDETLRHIVGTTKTNGPIGRPLQEGSKDQIQLQTAAFSFQAPAGTYRSSMAVRDSVTQRIGIYVKPLTVRDYNTDSVQISDIKLASLIIPQETPSPFTRNGLEITPHPAHIYPQSQPVYLYYEMYNLSQDTDGRTSYQTSLEITAKEKQSNIAWRLLSSIGRLVTRSSNDQSVLLTFEGEGTNPNEHMYTSIDTTDLPKGTYTLNLTIEDLKTGQTTYSSTEFVIVTN